MKAAVSSSRGTIGKSGERYCSSQSKHRSEFWPDIKFAIISRFSFGLGKRSAPPLRPDVARLLATIKVKPPRANHCQHKQNWSKKRLKQKQSIKFSIFYGCLLRWHKGCFDTAKNKTATVEKATGSDFHSLYLYTRQYLYTSLYKPDNPDSLNDCCIRRLGVTLALTGCSNAQKTQAKKIQTKTSLNS